MAVKPFVPFIVALVVPVIIELILVCTGVTSLNDTMLDVFLVSLLRPIIFTTSSFALALDVSRRSWGIRRIPFLVLLALLLSLFFVWTSVIYDAYDAYSSPPALLSKLIGFRTASNVQRLFRKRFPTLFRPNTKKLIHQSLGQLTQIWYGDIAILRGVIAAYQALRLFVEDSRVFWYILVPAYFLLWIWDWAFYLYQDYAITFKDLGRGGSAPTFEGWALARLRAWLANVNVLLPPRVPPMTDPYRGHLNSLPQREGPRPTIQGVTPQRQVDFRAPPNTQAQLEKLMVEFAHGPTDTEPDAIDIAPSFLEPGLQALRRTLTVAVNANGGPEDVKASFDGPDEFGGEIYHPHRDGTSHVILHPEDERTVLEAGWGEIHPFATETWYWKLYFYRFLGIRRPVPTGLMILYAPRHQGEFDVIRTIIAAAIWNETRGRLYPLTPDTYPIPPAPTQA